MRSPKLIHRAGSVNLWQGWTRPGVITNNKMVSEEEKIPRPHPLGWRWDRRQIDREIAFIHVVRDRLQTDPDIMTCWDILYMGASSEGYARIDWLLECLTLRRYQVGEELHLEWDEQELDRITVSFLRQKETCSASALLRYAQSIRDHLPPRPPKETVWDWLKATLSKL